MSKGILYIGCGIPGSGKTTFFNDYKKENEVVISRDEIRFSLLKDGDKYFDHEDEVFRIFTEKIAENINNGINTFADATHLNSISRNKLINELRALDCTPADIQPIVFVVPIKICFERNEKRKNTKTYVPRGVIRRMNEQFTLPLDFPLFWVVDEKGEVTKYVTR